jgi:regulator of ribosome biosynthesis
LMNIGSNVDGKEDDLVYDLGNLTALDSHGINEKELQDPQERENNLKRAARDNVQLLVNQLFNLPYDMDNLIGMVALLPDQTTAIPREKHVPEPKPLTKWQKFAKEKGIKNTKKSRMVYDEESEEYRPRFGYKSKSDLSDWAIPVKDNEDPYADPFAKAKLDKTSRILKNKMAQIKNLDAANKIKGKKNVPIGIPESNNPRTKVKFGKVKLCSYTTTTTTTTPITTVIVSMIQTPLPQYCCSENR